MRLISPQFVKPFVKTNKNDVNDAEAIVIAAQQSGMRFVPIKTQEQQDIQSLHRVRSRLIADRTELVNQTRGILSEYGIVFGLGVAQVRRGLPIALEDAENNLTDQIRCLLSDLYDELVSKEELIKCYDKKVKVIFKNNPLCQRLEKVEGIGVLTATILLTVLGDGSAFKSGRHFAAYLGLVPKQYSSGGKQRLLGISKL